MYSESLGLKISKGYELMSKSSVFLCGLARDIDKHLANIIPQINSLLSKFRDYHVFIYENDSKDGTKDVLRKWKSEHPFDICIRSEDIGTKRLTDLSSRRIEFMATYRNICLDYFWDHYIPHIQSPSDYYKTPYQYLIVLDLDLLGFSIDGIASSFGCFAEDQKCGGIGSNGRKNTSVFSPYFDIYYDAFAHKCNRTIEHNFGNIQQTYRKFNIGDDLINVDSCFGGLAIYRTDAIRQARYSAFPRYAEHVALNQEIKQNGYGIYLNPNQLTYYDNIVRMKYQKLIG